MRDIKECWLQTPEVLEEEIKIRRELMGQLGGDLYRSIVFDEICILIDLRDERLKEEKLTKQ